MRHVDITTAFLNAKLPAGEQVYMELPRGFAAALGGAAANTVCFVKRALYGLKQSPRVWYETLRAALERHGWTCAADIEPTVFSFGGGNGSNATAYLVAYVDDLLITAAFPDLLQHLVTDLLGEFAGRDLGFPSYYLGIQSSPTRPWPASTSTGRRS